MGVGIIAGMAFDAERDQNLRALSAGHLFGTNVSRVAIKQGAYLRSYVYTFIELMTPTLNRKLVEGLMNGEQPMYEL
jgi:LysR family cys regulon transcriptional activator